MKNIFKKISATAMAIALLGAGTSLAPKTNDAAKVHAAHQHCACSGVRKEYKCLTGSHYYVWVYSNCCGHLLYTYIT
ncbi:hypothetical protein [Ruminococcus sp.]|uniref:hypothetical protein n=1 Tax=Ruminococcus sp. TaxID=41978 RepID=UPI0025D7B9C0|nr:hypothetical protein [Ruminococcus sp.]MBR1429898.1 hypothetical protein [Ruminococcus sp.]